MNRDIARDMRKNPTEAERTLWVHLRYRQMNSHKFRRQHPMGRYIVDFVCLEKRLVIEIDGCQHSDRTAYDSVRSDWLESQGFQVLRFWNNQVFRELDGVKTAILAALEFRSYTNPPPS